MTIQTMLRAVFQKRPSVVRWAYLPIATVLAFFALYGFGDEGFWAGCPFLLLLLVCLLQFIYPTLLGWMLLFGASLAYTLAVAFNPHKGPLFEFVFFLLCGAVPAAVLFFWDQQNKEPDRLRNPTHCEPLLKHLDSWDEKVDPRSRMALSYR